MKKQTIIILGVLLGIAFLLSFQVFAGEDNLEEFIDYDALEFEDGEHYEILTDDSIKVILDGNELDFTDENGNKVEPQIINDRTMVPMRKIFEALGAEVRWNPTQRAILATKDGITIGLQIDSNIATIDYPDGQNVITLDAAPVIVNDRTLVPVRFIAESLNKNVDWDSDTRTVIISDADADAEYYVVNPEEDLSETIYYNYWIDANIEE